MLYSLCGGEAVFFPSFAGQILSLIFATFFFNFLSGNLNFATLYLQTCGQCIFFDDILDLAKKRHLGLFLNFYFQNFVCRFIDDNGKKRPLLRLIKWKIMYTYSSL